MVHVDTSLDALSLRSSVSVDIRGAMPQQRIQGRTETVTVIDEVMPDPVLLSENTELPEPIRVAAVEIDIGSVLVIDAIWKPTDEKPPHCADWVMERMVCAVAANDVPDGLQKDDMVRSPWVGSPISATRRGSWFDIRDINV